MEAAPPGYIDLLMQDKDYLMNMLYANNGSKDSISHLRSWVLERAHSATAISILIRDYTLQLYSSSKTAAIQRMLYVIYLLNDIFFHCAEVNY